MTPILFRPFVLTLFMAFIVNSLSAQDMQSVRRLQLKTQKSITKLAKIVKKNSPDSLLLNETAVLNKTTAVLYSKIYEKMEQSGTLDSMFFASLAEAQHIIDTLAATALSDSTKEMIASLNSDFLTKIHSAPAGLQSAIKTQIKVIVRARADGTDQPGHKVYANYMWDFNNSKPRFFSNNPTNDAVLFLSPGYYVVWVQKDKASAKQKVKIGIEKKDEEEIIILL